LFEQFSVPTIGTSDGDEPFVLDIENLGKIATRCLEPVALIVSAATFWTYISFLFHELKHIMDFPNQKVTKTLLTNCLGIGYSVGVVTAA